MGNVFLCLPYGTLPFISTDNMASVSQPLQAEFKDYFPVPRAFPKGTLGMYSTKILHDDNNSALLPLMWTSIIGDENVSLTFYGVDFEPSLKATTDRFCWFMG